MQKALSRDRLWHKNITKGARIKISVVKNELFVIQYWCALWAISFHRRVILKANKYFFSVSLCLLNIFFVTAKACVRRLQRERINNWKKSICAHNFHVFRNGMMYTIAIPSNDASHIRLTMENVEALTSLQG